MPESLKALRRLGGTSGAGWVFRIGGTCVFAFVALWGIHIGEVLRTLEGLSSLWLAAAVACLAVSHAVASGRWWLLLREAGARMRFLDTIRTFFVGLFFTNVLPTGFGGDAVRAWSAGRTTNRRAAATASVLADRMNAVWALAALGLGTVLLGWATLPGSIVVSVLAAVVAIAVGSSLLMTRRPLTLALRLLTRWPRVRDALSSTGSSLHGIYGRRSLLGTTFALSVLAQVAVVAAAWCLARGLSLDIGPLLLAAAIPVVMLVTAVPTSVNGLGVREAAFRVLLAPAGVGAADAVAFSLATVVAGLVVSLPGAAWWLSERTTAKSASLSSEPRKRRNLVS